VITRFRIEGTDPDKENLIDELSQRASEIIRLVDSPSPLWECTDDVVSFDSAMKQYKGRMVLVLRSGS
jgi:hypothetical protein